MCCGRGVMQEMSVVFMRRGVGKTGKNDALVPSWRVRVAISRSESDCRIRKTTKCLETGTTRFSPVIASLSLYVHMAYQLTYLLAG
jgi:hypothetical protein